MPVRSTPLITGQYYHIFSRGTAGIPIFKKPSDYRHLLRSINYYQYQNSPVRLSSFMHYPFEDQYKIMKELEDKDEKNVDIVCYALIPNHYHLLSLQKTENGITRFCKKVNDSHSRQFNTKHHRLGTLFQGVFKAVRVETIEQLLHLSRYIHLNPLVSYVVKEKDFFDYPWSSLKEILSGNKGFIKPEIILSSFESREKYKEFILDQVGYAKELENIKHLMIEKEEDP